jgi:hypothetical protein
MRINIGGGLMVGSEHTTARIVVIDYEFARHYALRSALQEYYIDKKQVSISVYQNEYGGKELTAEAARFYS